MTHSNDERQFHIAYERIRAKDYGYGDSIEDSPARGSLAKTQARSRPFTKGLPYKIVDADHPKIRIDA